MEAHWLLILSVKVITPEEIVDPNVDEHSVMTYLSQFPKAKLKPGAPLRPKLNPKKARAYGPGERARQECSCEVTVSPWGCILWEMSAPWESSIMWPPGYQLPSASQTGVGQG